MLKQKDLEALADKAVADDITTGHLKILMYIMAHGKMLSVNAPIILKCSQQYSNKLLKSLLEKGYLERTQILHSRVYTYTLKPAEEKKNSPKKTK